MDIRKRVGSRGTSYQVRYKDPATGKYRYKSFDRRKDAVAFMQGGSSNHVHDRDTVTFADAADHWLETCEKYGRNGREPVERSTLRKYQSHAKILNAIDGTRLMNGYARADCETIRRKLMDEYSREYARKIWTSFKSIMIDAKHAGWIADNPADGMVITLSARAQAAKKAAQEPMPSLTEFKTILKAAREMRDHRDGRTSAAWRRFYPLTLVSAFGGFRPGEAVGIPWRNVDFTNSRIKIDQDATEFQEIGDLKTASSYRTVDMPKAVMLVLKEWKLACPASDLDLVFPTGRGMVESRGNLHSRWWMPLMAQAKLLVDGRAKYPPKALRHARASFEIAEGATIKEIQALAGHADVRTTLNIYGHLFPEHAGDRVARAEKMSRDLL